MPFADDAAFVDEVGAIDDRKRFAHVVIGDQNGEAGFAQVDDDLLDVVDRDRIDAAERLVEHEQLRLGNERTRNRQAPLLAAAQGERGVFRDPFDPELMEQLVATLAPFLFAQAAASRESP